MSNTVSVMENHERMLQSQLMPKIIYTVNNDTFPPLFFFLPLATIIVTYRRNNNPSVILKLV